MAKPCLRDACTRDVVTRVGYWATIEPLDLAVIGTHRAPKIEPRTVARLTLALALAGAAAPCLGYSFGSGVCVAVADGGFMQGRTHHPGQNGGFGLQFTTPDYIPGETVGVTLSHAGSEQFTGFLLYAEDPFEERRGLFGLVSGTTFSGGLPAACANFGHTITHDPALLRSRLTLAWTAPTTPARNQTFRALVLRADPMAQRGTDFYEVLVPLPVSSTGVFRSRFESIPEG